MSSALVTGASSGIGLEIAKILSKDVDRLVITGRRKDLLDELADILSMDAEVEVVVADLSISSEVDRLIDVAGDIDILVNNASSIETSLFEMTKISNMKKIFDINYFNQVEFTQLIVKKLKYNR